MSTTLNIKDFADYTLQKKIKNDYILLRNQTIVKVN